MGVALAVLSLLAINVAPWYLVPAGWLGLGTAMFLTSSVVTSCALGTFSRRQWINDMVGALGGLPLLVSYSSLVEGVSEKRQHAQRSLGRSYFWMVSSLVDTTLNNFATWKPSPSLIANNIGILVFAATGFSVIVKYFGFTMLGKYYLAPLAVFHLWQSLSIKVRYSDGVARISAAIDERDTMLVQVARLIHKRYKADDINLRDVSRIYSKACRALIGRRASLPFILHKIAGWEMLTPRDEVIRSLRVSIGEEEEEEVAAKEGETGAAEAKAKSVATPAVAAEQGKENDVFEAKKEVAKDEEASLLRRRTRAAVAAPQEEITPEAAAAAVNARYERALAAMEVKGAATTITKVSESGEVIEDDVYFFDYSKTTKLFLMHSFGCYGLYLALTGQCHYNTLWLSFAMYWLAGLGITGGYHRLWAHKSYSCSRPVQWLLAFYGAAAGEGSIFWWSRDHRMHHKFEETRKDPYSIRYGFWWAHIGWLMHYKSAYLMREGKRLCEGGLMNDLKKNDIVMFQHRHFGAFFFGAAALQPMLIASLWGDAWGGLWVGGALATMLTFESTMCVNSLAHMWGERPYNKRITAVQNGIVAMITYGEGWHNFHHAFPTDFRGSDKWYQWNPTRWLIKGLEKSGLAWNLKMRVIRVKE